MTGLMEKADVVQQLQKQILALQGFKRSVGIHSLDTGLGPLQAAFPEHTFPTGAVHELISYSPEDAAATCGFIAGLAGKLMQAQSRCLWISTRSIVFPPALKIFGIEPHQVIFIDLTRQKEALWAIEEALKCKAVATVVGELPELSFAESRRLQLAVEHSRVTGFIHRHRPRSENTVACVTRWKITPLVSAMPDGLPGLGLPRWNVALTKVRNGRPGAWAVEWNNSRFMLIERPAVAAPHIQKSKTG